MRTFIIVLSLACLALCGKELVNSINTAQNQWVAKEYQQFANLSTEEISQYMGTILKPLDVNIVSYEDILSYTDVPAAFDARTAFPGCVHEIRNQAKCGSCWAFGASEAFSDRVCIASKGAINVVFSPEWILACDHGNMGCNGGILNFAWRFIRKTGLVSEECMPYTSAEGKVDKCPSTCVDGSTPQPIKAKNIRGYKSAADAKLDILTNGPIETGFKVYEDFIHYAGGVYKYTEGKFLGGHAIKVVGWGNENGVNYWIAANSWGAGWGESGFFRIQEGECSFENQMIAADADL